MSLTTIAIGSGPGLSKSTSHFCAPGQTRRLNIAHAFRDSAQQSKFDDASAEPERVCAVEDCSVPRPVDCQHGFVGGDVDAGHSGYVADDLADRVTFADRANADRGEPACAAAGAAGWSDRGYLRQAQAADLLADVDAV